MRSGKWRRCDDSVRGSTQFAQPGEPHVSIVDTFVFGVASVCPSDRVAFASDLYCVSRVPGKSVSRNGGPVADFELAPENGARSGSTKYQGFGLHFIGEKHE
jgi:hypothetical protein